MSRIKSKLTGDVFEAPAADFANEADFEIVDDSTPITVAAPNAGATSATAATDSTSGTTAGTVDTPSVTNTDPVVVDVGSVNTVSELIGAHDDSDVLHGADVGNVSAGAVESAPVASASTAEFMTNSESISSSAEPAVLDSGSTSTVNPASSASTLGTSDLGNVVAAIDPSASATPASVDSSEVVDPNVGGATGGAQNATNPSPISTSSTNTDDPQDATTASVGSTSPSDAGNVAGSVDNTSQNSAPVVADSTGSSPQSSNDDTGGSSGAGDTGNVVASTDSSAAAGAAPSTVSSTSSVSASLSTSAKHIVATQLESDMLFAVAQIVTPTDSIKHAADAFFAMVNSQIDVEAAS